MTTATALILGALLGWLAPGLVAAWLDRLDTQIADALNGPDDDGWTPAREARVLAAVRAHEGRRAL